ncbi:MAG: NAD-dependent epimerase/dehydratase family protein [Pseudomonadota bacterium]
MTRTILVLGASGKIGRHGAQAFEAAGWKVKRYDRETGDMIAAARGADVILNGMNPPNYHDWKNTIPAITAQVIEAAEANGATVIVPGNVYHFGDKPGVWSQDTPPAPVSRKGQIRLEMERTYKASDVQTIILRAGNFIDPNRQDCPMSAIYLRSIKNDKVTLPGPASTRQAMCYLPDWSRAAVQLAQMRNELGHFEDIPFPGHTLTADEIKLGLESILNRKLRFVRFPWGIMRLLSPVWELARELHEMRYLWNTDHALDGARVKQLLPDFEPTQLKLVLSAALPKSAV